MNETEHKKYNDHFKMPFIFKDKMGRVFGQDENGHDPKLAVQEFIDAQDAWIDETIGQVALIQITPTESGGGFRYDLPQYLRRSKDANRQRKDNYTCLLLGAYSAKHVFDMLGAEEETNNEDFICIGF